MKINEEKLYPQYKQIQKTCLEQGTPIPYLISPYHIPEEYKYSYHELKLLKINREELKKKEALRKKKEYEITKDKISGTLMELWLDELNEFLRQNRQFKNIIEE